VGSALVDEDAGPILPDLAAIFNKQKNLWVRPKAGYCWRIRRWMKSAPVMPNPLKRVSAYQPQVSTWGWEFASSIKAGGDAASRARARRHRMNAAADGQKPFQTDLIS
jgi:hypothetical protein